MFFRSAARFRDGPAAPGRRPETLGGRPRRPRARAQPMTAAARSRSQNNINNLAGPPPRSIVSEWAAWKTRSANFGPKTFLQKKQNNSSAQTQKNAPPLAHTRSCDRRSLPHPSTRTRDHAQRRAWFRTPRATRLLGLSSTVGVYCSPFARTH